MLRRQASVLLVGARWNERERDRRELLAKLGTTDSEWSLTYNVASTFVIAIEMITTFDRLDIVHISDELLGVQGKGLWRNCQALAKLLADHPRRPWVVFGDDPKLDHLVLIFEGPGAPKDPLVRVERGELVDVICDRWAELERIEQPQAFA